MINAAIRKAKPDQDMPDQDMSGDMRVHLALVALGLSREDALKFGSNLSDLTVEMSDALSGS